MNLVLVNKEKGMGNFNLRALFFSGLVALVAIGIFFSIAIGNLDRLSTWITFGIIALFLVVACLVLYALISKGK